MVLIWKSLHCLFGLDYTIQLIYSDYYFCTGLGMFISQCQSSIGIIRKCLQLPNFMFLL